MKSITSIMLAAAILAAPVCAIAKPANTVKTTSFSEIVDRHLSGFNAVNVAGPFDVDIVQGPVESVKVEAPSEIMPHILTEVNDGVLKIYSKHEMWSWEHMFGFHKKIMVHVVIKDVNSINISGSGDVAFRDGLSASNLRLNISGSGDMVGSVTVANKLESSISGSGDMKLSGRAQTSTVSVVGSGDYAARRLATVSTAVRVSGSGDANINASDSVDAASSGSGDISYTGGAHHITSHKSGSGDISRD